ncbi:MAG: hypothetical protein J6W94_00260 [Bacteroidales bacterium]|nr:hypothetical protein [Bacteroidales bacterium]
MRNFLIFAAAILCLLSCNKGPAPSSYGDDEILFRADGTFSASVTTKATEVTGSNLSQIYVNASQGTSGSEEELWSNVSFSKSSDKYSGGKYWPNYSTNSIRMHFYSSNLPLTFSSTGAIVSVPDNSTDVVCAYCENPSWKAENTLYMHHILARLGKCTISLPSGYNGSGLTVKITLNYSGTYNIRTAKWITSTPASSQVTIATAFGSSGNANDIYLLPGNYTLTATYTLTKGTGSGAYSETFTKTASVNLAPGMINLISATLPEGEATDIVFAVTVNPWTDYSITASFS